MRGVALAALVAAVVAAGVALREWRYNTNHPFAPGPSAELAVGFAAVALLAAAVAWLAVRLLRDREARELELEALHARVAGLRRDLDDETETRRAVAAMQAADP